MKKIEVIKLYRYLTETEEKAPWEAIMVIRKLRKLPHEYLNTLRQRMLGDTTADLQESDVWLSELIEDEDMQLTQALLMLDWIRRNPGEALHFMAEERLRSPMEPLNEEQKRQMRDAIEAFKLRGLKVDEESIPESIEQLSESEKQDMEIVS